MIAIGGMFSSCDNLPNDPGDDSYQPIVIDDGGSGDIGDTGDTNDDNNSENDYIVVFTKDGPVETDIPNYLVDEETVKTLQDYILECWEDSHRNNKYNHGTYVSCIAHLTRDMVRAGIITGAEKGVIDALAARSEEGK